MRYLFNLFAQLPVVHVAVPIGAFPLDLITLDEDPYLFGFQELDGRAPARGRYRDSSLV